MGIYDDYVDDGTPVTNKKTYWLGMTQLYMDNASNYLINASGSPNTEVKSLIIEAAKINAMLAQAAATAAQAAS